MMASKNKLRVPVPAAHVYAYMLGAVHYATGLGLDRLAKDLGEERAKTESDHDLSVRLSTLLKVR